MKNLSMPGPGTFDTLLLQLINVILESVIYFIAKNMNRVWSGTAQG